MNQGLARPVRELAVCADDFGHSEAVNRGILRAAAAARLTEVSCLVNSSRWTTCLSELIGLPATRAGHLRLGLHFNLTEGRPLSDALRRVWPQLPSLPRLLLLSHLHPLRPLPLAALSEELRAQLACFEAAVGGPPAHLDGHQHVIHLPGVRKPVLAELARRPGLRARHTGHVAGPGFVFKRLVIAASGGRALGRALTSIHQASNTTLLGVYDFVQTDYRHLMQAWLAQAPAQGALLFCHPGEAAAPAQDPIAAARVRELAYLVGPDFAADLQAAGVTLAFNAQRSNGD